MRKKWGIAMILIVIMVGAFIFTNQASASEMIYSHKEIIVEYNTKAKIKDEVTSALLKDDKVIVTFKEEAQKDIDAYIFTVEVKPSDSTDDVANEIVDVYVKMEDTQVPVIETKVDEIELEVGDTFSIEQLEISAYDVVDGKLNYDIIENDVNTEVTGEYTIVIEARDVNQKSSRKQIHVHVHEKEIIMQPQAQVQSIAPSEPLASQSPSMPSLDRSNLHVRGWKIVAGSNVSDDVIRSYVNELESLPVTYNQYNLHTILIDTSKPYPYLGMAYSDGRLWLNGAAYYATTALHEATHAYDFYSAISRTPEFEAIYVSEKGKLPVKYSANMNDNTYEWLANAVVFYYYDKQTLLSNAPQTYTYIEQRVLI
ncbi:MULTISPECIES: hypothetical protein [unclassified Breznakia]|uniref:hypothetical protein n=1 Tax=unclassified Breznakia TaxID=2623764 RepID=UPI002472F216|nr:MULTISPECIES: hypothetical protein [unclassified Breznakia]MDH6366598.1 hypothetical protein [Breznakia sp. PH1-1]MDH6403691.1 hypothetical protein [Breznakia sp. PF1-11]MDH6411400.1 hypothetical protein [Breznakia sp. PFB1-11]MDH6413869.1 hypothetical protein [Breznakia sp. PFB1-14]MDH6416299.1 hypothetical protein [Breznakia sp. PFB1-4]